MAKTWKEKDVLEQLRIAILVDVYLPKDQRQAMSNSWPATVSFSYEWLHRLTEDFMPIQYIGGIETEQHLCMKIEIFRTVAMRWLEWVDNVNCASQDIRGQIYNVYKRYINQYK